MENKEDGYFSLIARHSNKAVDVDTNTLKLQQYQKHSGDNQLWKAIDNGDGTIRLMSKAKEEYCITLKEDSKENGIDIVISKWEGKATQKLKLHDIDGNNLLADKEKIESGEVYRIKAKHSNLYLEASGDCDANGSEITQREYKANDKKQLWRIVRLSDNTYKIVNMASKEGKVIDVRNALNENENNLQMYVNLENNKAQNWKFDKNSDGTYTIKSRIGDISKAITIYQNSSEIGFKSVIYDINYKDNQKFYLEEVIPSKEKKYIETTGEYSEDGRYLASMKDQLGNKTKYEYDTNRGLTLKEIDPKGNATNYEYDTKTDNLQKYQKKLATKNIVMHIHMKMTI